MKLFVLFLIIGLSTSDKLNRAYLPPPGAKFSGGRAEYLQTPLDYPKETPVYNALVNTETRFGDETLKAVFNNELARNFDTDVNTVIPIDEGFSIMPTGNVLPYTDTAYQGGGLETTAKPSKQNTIDNTQNIQPGFGPINGYPTKQEAPDHFGTFRTSDRNFGKPGNMPIITPKGIMQNYQPKAFGMYGGSPMIIKAHSGLPTQFIPVNMFGDYNRNNNYPASHLITFNESNESSSQKPDAYIVTSSALNDISKPESLFTTISPVKNVLHSNTNLRNEVQKHYHKRPERPQAKSDRNANILNYDNVLTSEGYAYSFDTPNGIHKDESATTVDGVKAQGAYSYTGDDGKVYSVIYTADENGFQPRGDHLPTPPPIPKAIQKVIEQAKRNKEAGMFNDGFYDEEKYGHMKYQGPVNRYLQNMRTNSAVKNRNRVLKHKMMDKKLVSLKNRRLNQVKSDKNKGVMRNNLQRMNKQPKNDFDEQHGNQNIPSTKQRIKENKVKGDDSKNLKISRPIASVMLMNQEEPNFIAKLRKPSGTKYNFDLLQPVGKKTKVIQVSTSPNENVKETFSKIEKLQNMSMINPYQTQGLKFGLEKYMNLYKTTTPQEGYFYVPPTNIFIEGRFQDQPTIFKEVPNQYGQTYDNVDKTDVLPVSKLYYVDQTGKYNFQDEPISKMTSYITTTEEPLNLKEYESTNPDVDQSIQNKRLNAVKISSEGIKVTMTTAQPYVSPLSMNTNDQDYTDGFSQEETISPENKDDFPSTRNDIAITSYQSTTPMLSQTQYTSKPLGNPNQYEITYPPTEFDSNSATNHSENEGYFRTTPEVSANFEDFPSSTSIYTVDGEADLTSNVKVDGFGRPILDTYETNANLPNRYFNTGNADDVKTDINSRTFTDIATFESDKLNINSIGDSEIEKATAINFDKMTTIGEDFSGPKQPQRYDPENGYFY